MTTIAAASLDFIVALPVLAITTLLILAYSLGRTVERMKHEQEQARMARIHRGQRASG